MCDEGDRQRYPSGGRIQPIESEPKWDIFTIGKICTLEDEQSLRTFEQFCRDNNLVNIFIPCQTATCRRHHMPCNLLGFGPGCALMQTPDKWRFRCSACRKGKSAWNGTYFNNTRLGNKNPIPVFF